MRKAGCNPLVPPTGPSLMLSLGNNFCIEREACYCKHDLPSSPQPFWHQGPVSWKTVFPWIMGGWFGDDSSALCLLCTLLLLHQLHLRSSSIRSWRLETMTYNPRRGWPSPNSSLSSDYSLSQIYSLLVFKCEGSQLVLLRWSVGANPFNLIIVSALLFLFTHLFWLHWVFVAVWGLSLVVASRCCSPVAVWGRLIAVASLVAERGLLSTQASVVVVIVTHGPSCPEACGIFLDQGSNPCPLRWQVGSQPLDHQGSPVFFFFSHTS